MGSPQRDNTEWYPSVADLLRRSYPELTSGQRRIADYILQHEDDVPFLTAAQLAERVGVSESAVVRFAQRLGFDGYPDFRRAVRSDFRQRVNHRTMMLSGRAALAGQQDLVDEIARADALLIRETAARLDRATLERCADRLVAAQHVFAVGHRTSYALAEYLAVTLRQGIGVGSPLSFGSGMAFDILAAANPGDVVVAISITPYSRETLDILRAAQGLNLFRIAITDHPLGEPARLADEVIVFESEIRPFTSSYVSAVTVIHILLALVSLRIGDRAETFLRRVDSVHNRFNIRVNSWKDAGSLSVREQ